MRKDLNYIAAVEKAISEKYGKNTVQDFRSEWHEDKEKDYLEQLKNRRLKKQNINRSRKKIEIGDVVISRRRLESQTDRVCPVCKTYSFSPVDDLYMNSFDCCHKCYINFVEFREERWKTGWRPSDGEYKPPRIKSWIRAMKQHINRFLRRVKKWLAF